MNDITSHEDIDLECAIAWADDKLFAEAMRNGADLSRGLSSYRDGSGFGMKLEVHQRPLALAISKSQYDVAISLLEHHAPRLSLNSWAEGYIISFLPFPSHQGLRSELCLFTCLLYEFHQDQGRQTDELLHAREKFLDALLLHIQPQTCGETNRCVECHACLASATAVPYSIFAKLVTGAVDPTTKNTNFVPVGPLSVTCWQMQIFNDATVKDGHPAMSQQMCKFCRFVSMLPVEEAASTRKQILFFIIKFLLAPEAHLNKAHGSANIEMHETVKTSRFDLLFGHLSTLFDTYDDLNIDMRWQDTPDTLLQYAARSVRLRNTIIPPEDQREPPAEVFHIPYPHDPKATGVNMGALAVCSFLLKNGATPISTARYEADRAPACFSTSWKATTLRRRWSGWCCVITTGPGTVVTWAILKTRRTTRHCIWPAAQHIPQRQ